MSNGKTMRSPSPDDRQAHYESAEESLLKKAENSPTVMNSVTDSITTAEPPLSPLLLERSVSEFERQVEVVYKSKMIPRPKSLHLQEEMAGTKMTKRQTNPR